MPEFVNYHSRAVTLPLGCKDLMDVLQQMGEFGTGGTNLQSLVDKELRQSLPRTEHFITAGIEHVARFVGLLTGVPRRIESVTISLPDNVGLLTLNRPGEKTPPVILVNITDSVRGAVARACFRLRKLEPAIDRELFLAYALPPDETQIRELVEELLQVAYGVTVWSGLTFQYWELGT